MRRLAVAAALAAFAAIGLSGCDEGIEPRCGPDKPCPEGQMCDLDLLLCGMELPEIDARSVLPDGMPDGGAADGATADGGSTDGA